MGLTSAMNTSLNGLQLNETTIDVIGNNVANAGTNGFKASRTLFSTQLARTYSVGSAPTSTNGGTNPRQIGLGALNSAIQLDFTQGGITNSTSPSDLAIQGDGFFKVESPDGSVYTRNGNFTLNSDNKLVNSQGYFVQGFSANFDTGVVDTRVKTDIEIPLGQLQSAAETENAVLKGALFSGGEVATQGATVLSNVLFEGVSSGPRPNAAGTTKLVNLFADATTTSPLFQNGEVLTITPRKGGSDIDQQTLTIDANTDVDALMLFFKESFGIQTSGSSGDMTPDYTGTASWTPGVTISGGRIQINGNMGTGNDLDWPTASLQGSLGGTINLGMTKTQAADGESAISQFVVYDSLGQPVNVRLTTVLESTETNATVFRFYAESADDEDRDIAIGNGIFKFDGSGKYFLSDDERNTLSIDRPVNIDTPMTVTLDFSKLSGISTASAGSSISLNSQDGSGPGTLTTFVIDEVGKVNGVFDNGVIKVLGQIILARFSNPQGLIQVGSDAYRVGISSGLPSENPPGQFGNGTIRSGAIELSNTDIGRNLVDLIVASTQYRGNAKVISQVQQLTDELLLLNR
ncbi:MAG: flagellar hook-basal body complex protein [Planctomycetaceae bacterium]|nr:flagellar hook-basal body complex protein [Planctomycetaceae bacterium]